MTQNPHLSPEHIEPTPVENPIPHSDNIATIPNAMTLYRMVEGVALPISMIRGGEDATRHATLRAGIAGITDFESQVARRIEPHFPGRGYTTIGKRGDPPADTELAAGLSIGILFSKRASTAAKIGSLITAVKVGIQSVWAVKSDREHRRLTGEPYVADVDITGKIATGFMIAGAVAGTLTHDLNPNKPKQRAVRVGAGVASVAFSGLGLFFGEKARKQHDTRLQAKLASLRKRA